MVNVQQSDEVEAQSKQREASKKATFAKLKAKKLAEKKFSVYVNDDKLEIHYRAISHQKYDDLVSQFPPNDEQKVSGAMYDMNGFAPALIAAVCVSPDITHDEAKELWNSGDWSRGDLMVLFMNAVDVCNTGFDVPFTARG